MAAVGTPPKGAGDQNGGPAPPAGGAKGPRGPLPQEVHATLGASEIGDGRLIVVGDIHGCCEEFLEILEACECAPSDAVVLVGDLVNKGPESAAVVRVARERGFHAVRGNHDDAALAAYDSLARGGEPEEKAAWVAGMAEEDARWLRELPFTLRVPSHNLLVVGPSPSRNRPPPSPAPGWPPPRAFRPTTSRV